MSRRVALVVLLCCLSWPAANSHAGLGFTGYEWTWSETSQNGKYIFVSLLSDPIGQQAALIRPRGEDPPEHTHESEIAEVKRLHATYPRTGMYRNDGSTTPLWTTTEEVRYGVPSPDGKRLVDMATHYYFGIDVYEAMSPRRRLTDFEMIGLVPFALCSIADGPGREMDDYQLDANWEHMKVTWDNGSSTTVRLHDFEIVQSNTLGYALYHLITTVRGIVFLLVVTFVVTMIGYLLTNWVMRLRGRQERS